MDERFRSRHRETCLAFDPLDGMRINRRHGRIGSTRRGVRDDNNHVGTVSSTVEEEQDRKTSKLVPRCAREDSRRFAKVCDVRSSDVTVRAITSTRRRRWWRANARLPRPRQGKRRECIGGDDSRWSRGRWRSERFLLVKTTSAYPYLY